MKVMKLALLGTAALVAASMGARAENLDTLKAQMDSLTLNAVADAPAAATTSVSFTGYVRGAVVTAFDSKAAAGFQYYTDIRSLMAFTITGKTDTAVGEVGVTGTFRDLANAGGVANGGNTIGGDGFNGWWKITPAVTLKMGILGIQKSSYSWDAIAVNWFAGKTGGGVFGWGSTVNDPAAFGLYYGDGPLSFGLQAYDSNNAFSNASAFGLNAKIGYKMDAFGIDFTGDYAGRANGSAGWAVSGGAGYAAGPFSVGVALGTGATPITGAIVTPGSAFAKLALSDSASFEAGVTRDFGSTNGNDTQFGMGMYYSPVKQVTFGIEAGYESNSLGAAAGDGSYSAGLVSAFTF